MQHSPVFGEHDGSNTVDSRQCPQRHIHSIIGAIEVDDKGILCIAIAGQQNARGDVRGFASKWGAVLDKSANTYVIEIAM